MLILELKPGELLRMRTPSGEVIDVTNEDSSQHRVRFSISAPPTIHIDTEGESGTTSKPPVKKPRKKSRS
jgi:Global regulator protein family